MGARAMLSRSLLAPLVMARNGSRELSYLRHYHRTQFLPPERLAEQQLPPPATDPWPTPSCILPITARLPRGRSGARGRCPLHATTWPASPPRERHLCGNPGPRYSSPIPAARRGRKRTSGSTGVPLRIFVDEVARQHKAALTARHNGWAGYRLGDPVGYVWGDLGTPTTFRGRMRAALLERIEALDSQKMDEARMEAFTARLRRRRACASSSATPSHYATTRIPPGAGRNRPPVRGAIPTAMVLYPNQRRLLEQVFGAEVFERYGSEETSIIASECPEHRGLHLAEEGLLVEVLNADGSPTAPGEEGEIVVTDLLDRALPLIRYRLGDAGIRGEACSCGRGLSVLARVYGRLADNVVTPEGKIVSGISITDHIVEVEGIRQVQIVQEARDELLFRIVRDDRFSEQSEACLRGHCARHLRREDAGALRVRSRPFHRPVGKVPTVHLEPGGGGGHLVSVPPRTVALVIDNHGLGGAELVLARVVGELRAQGYPVLAIVGPGEGLVGKLHVAGVPTHVMDFYVGARPRMLRSRRSLCERRCAPSVYTPCSRGASPPTSSPCGRDRTDWSPISAAWFTTGPLRGVGCYGGG